MTTFIHGSDKGFIVLKSIAIMFFLFLFLMSILEIEHRKSVQARYEYELAVEKYENALLVRR